MVLIEKIQSDNINVDVKIMHRAKKELERLKFEININNFIGTLQFVENYKTIQKSVYLLGQMYEEAIKQGIKIDSKIVDKIHKESERLKSERNLRHHMGIILLSQSTPELVKNLEDLLQIAEKNEVSVNYLSKAKDIIEKMKENIESHNILRKFIDYPIREYPDFTPVDPKKKPNPAEEAKKKKKEAKIPIPAWAEELPGLVRQVEALDHILKRAAILELSSDFIDHAKENMARMRKEIKFRQMEEEEAKQLADKKQQDKNKKK